MEKVTLKSTAEKMGLTSNKVILAQFVFLVWLLVSDLMSKETRNKQLNLDLNRVESCIKAQEKYIKDLEIIDIEDLKKCVSNSQKLTKKELDNVLNI